MFSSWDERRTRGAHFDSDSASISSRGMEPHSRTLTFTVLSGDVIDGDAVVADMLC